jgi:predicted acyl esterase
MPVSRQATNCHLHLGILLVLLLLANRLPATAEPAATVDSAGQEIIALPTPTGSMLQTRVLRPAGREPFPLAIISHGSPADPSQRPTMAIPTFSSVSNWFVARGYMVALPLRRGYGQTGARGWKTSDRAAAPTTIAPA